MKNYKTYLKSVNQRSLDKKTAQLTFISGVGSGLGRELAFLLAKEKVPLLLTSKDPQKLQIIKESLQAVTSIEIHPADLSNEKDLAEILNLIRSKKPDLIINNAGFGLYGDILSFPLEEQMKLLKTNVDALVQISIESARALRENSGKGVIMNISSAAAFFTYPSFALYAASKRFVKEFSLSFDEELSPHNIRVLTCLLGRFHSDFRYKASSFKSSSSKSWDTMSLSKTAKKVLLQIKKKKRCQVIDWKYKILCTASQLMPRRWLAKRLKKGIDHILKS